MQSLLAALPTQPALTPINTTHTWEVRTQQPPPAKTPQHNGHSYQGMHMGVGVGDCHQTAHCRGTTPSLSPHNKHHSPLPPPLPIPYLVRQEGPKWMMQSDWTCSAATSSTQQLNRESPWLHFIMATIKHNHTILNTGSKYVALEMLYLLGTQF